MAFDLENTVNYRIVTTESLLRRSIFRVISHNSIEITPEQLPMLYFLWRKDGLTVGELAKNSKKDFANTTRIVDKLIAAGYAEKRQNTDDCRKYNIYVTNLGEAIKEIVHKCWHESLGIATNGISKKDQTLLISLLLKIDENILAFLDV